MCSQLNTLLSAIGLSKPKNLVLGTQIHQYLWHYIHQSLYLDPLKSLRDLDKNNPVRKTCLFASSNVSKLFTYSHLIWRLFFNIGRYTSKNVHIVIVLHIVIIFQVLKAWNNIYKLCVYVHIVLYQLSNVY